MDLLQKLGYPARSFSDLVGMITD